MKELGDKEVDWGTKHKKISFRKVFETDPGYVSWMQARSGTALVPASDPEVLLFLVALGANCLRAKESDAEDPECLPGPHVPQALSLHLC